MNGFKAGLALVLVLGLAGCSGGQVVGRAIEGTGSITGLLTGDGMGDKAMIPAAYDVSRVEISVPHTLRVSEANTFVPMADIVWHGDPLGDRYEQVRSIIDEAARRGTVDMTRGESVVVQIEVMRFHALTPKARYTFGGNFATRFLLTVRDAGTGQLVDGPRLVVADAPASGGQRAMEEEAQGITQRVVIVSHVAEVLRRELSRRLVPKSELGAGAVSRNSFQPAELGMMQ